MKSKILRLWGFLPTRMSGQAKISSFLKPLQQKRTNVEEMKTPPKKPKLESTKTPEKQTGQENLSENELSPVSPEQKKRMEENRLSAKMKLAATKSHGLVINVGPSWYSALEPEFSKPYFEKLAKFIEAERKSQTIYPPAPDLWSWTLMGNIRDVKVVILGQDPYHGPGQAHGLCFSVQEGVPPPPSLQNMYKELANDIPGFTHPGHGNLSGWARQGVLLLNAVLTVRARSANSHKDKGWEQLTDSVVTWLNRNTEGLVFLLWGSYAQKKGASINKSKHHVLKGVHPSPLSAHRGYFGCKHFSKCNEFLEASGKKPIDWKDLPSC